jgi:hypothetical protein
MPGDERTQEVLTANRPLLATGELELVGLMPNASNYTFLAVTTAATAATGANRCSPQARGAQPCGHFRSSLHLRGQSPIAHGRTS